jgi:hypothetical protein
MKPDGFCDAVPPPPRPSGCSIASVLFVTAEQPGFHQTEFPTDHFWREAAVPNISCVRLTSRNMWPALGKLLTGVGVPTPIGELSY